MKFRAFILVCLLTTVCQAQQELVNQLDVVQQEANALRTLPRAGEIAGSLDALDQAIANAKAAAEGLQPLPEPPQPTEGVEVTEEFILTPHDVIPRFAYPPTISSIQSGPASDPATWGGRVPGPEDKVCVCVGHTVTFDSTLDVYALEVSGTFRVAGGLNLRVQHFQALPGSLLAGTATRENPAEIVLRDAPLEPHDPAEWGNGVLVFGRIDLQGQYVTPYAMTDGMVPGDTDIPLREPVEGWLLGDRLHLPVAHYDMARPHRTNWTGPLQLEFEYVMWQQGEPVAFHRLVPRRHDGTAVTYPHVANTERAIVFRSENPSGVRGHFALAGNARGIIRGVAFDGLGRTKAAPVISDPSIPGHNQVGRYSLHLHKLLNDNDPTQFPLVHIDDCSINDFLKWGVVVHGTNHCLVTDTTSFDGVGAAFSTEHGNEVGNAFVRCIGGSMRIAEHFDSLDAAGNPVYNGKPNNLQDDGADGQVFYLASPHVDLIDCTAYGGQTGFDIWQLNGENGELPFGTLAFRGLEFSFPTTLHAMPKGNVGQRWDGLTTWSSFTALETWDIGVPVGQKLPVPPESKIVVNDFTSIFNQATVNVYQSGNTTFNDPVVIGVGAIHLNPESNAAFVSGGTRGVELIANNPYVYGCSTSVWNRQRGAGDHVMEINGGELHSTLRGVYAIDFIQGDVVETIVRDTRIVPHPNARLSYPANPAYEYKDLVFGPGLPDHADNQVFSPVRFHVYGYQGGNWKLYMDAQLPDWVWPVDGRYTPEGYGGKRNDEVPVPYRSEMAPAEIGTLPFVDAGSIVPLNN